MSVKTFMISCLLPAPVILYSVIINLRRKISILCGEKLLTETIPIETVGSVKRSLDTQVKFQACTDSENIEIDIQFIDEDNDDDDDDDKKYDSTLCDYHKLSSNVRKSDSIVSTDLAITPVKTMTYSKSEKVILITLLEHYKELNVFGMRLTWLCIHKLYRVVLVACNAFITEPVFRICLMTLVLIILAITNSLVKPYNDYKANLTSSFSYAANLCLAISNILKAALVTFDCKSNCSFQTTVLWYFDLVENVLLSYVPCLFIAAWFLNTVIKKCIQKNKKD